MMKHLSGFFLAVLTVLVFLLGSGCSTTQTQWPDNPMGLSVDAVEYTTDPEGRACFALQCHARPGEPGPFEKEGQRGRLSFYPLLSVYDGSEWVEYNGLLLSTVLALDEDGNGSIYLYQDVQNFPIPVRFTPEEGAEYRLKLTLAIRYIGISQRPAETDVYPVGEYPVKLLTNGELYAMGDS